MGIKADGQDDEHVSRYCDQIHGQKHPKQDLLLFRTLRDPQEEEVRDPTLVASMHFPNYLQHQHQHVFTNCL